MDWQTKVARGWEIALLAACIGILAATCQACPPPSTLHSQAAKTAYAGDQVVLRLGELQAAAIDANTQGLLSTETTRRVVAFTVDGAKTLKAAPAGWVATVGPAYAAMRNQLAPDERARLGPYLSALDLVFVAAGGVQ